jgi:hypothetical protein
MSFSVLGCASRRSMIPFDDNREISPHFQDALDGRINGCVDGDGCLFRVVMSLFRVNAVLHIQYYHKSRRDVLVKATR